MTIAHQLFSWLDLPLVFLILVIELLLSADNAAALAIIVKKLPENLRKKALFTGLYSAFILRAIGVIFTAFLIYLFWMQMIGGLYLIYLAWHYLFCQKKEGSSLSPTSYWKAVLYIELVDVLFAIDSILGAFALASLYYPFELLPSKLWVIYLGGILGVVSVRFMTGKLLKIINKHKKIEYIAFILIGWMGIKLLAEGSLSFINNEAIRHYCDIFFWVGTIFIVITGIFSESIKLVYTKYKSSKPLALLAFLLTCFSIEILGGLFSASSITLWYTHLKKPSWNPPDFVFSYVWTALYIMIAISGWLIFKSQKNKIRIKALSFYAVQLFLNLLWTYLFFYFQSPLLGLIDISLLLLSIVITTFYFWKILRKAALLLIPYLIWVSFSLSLNLAIWALN